MHEHRRTGRVFALLALTQFMVVLDASVVNVALPSIQRDLGLTSGALAWVVNAYLLTFGGFLLVGGAAADRFGRRRVFLAGLVVFTAASLACGLSSTGWDLLAARAAQGLGAAFASPAAFALVTDIYAEGPRRVRALAVWGGMGGIAGAAGVLLGGFLTAAGWQLVFLVNVPVGIAVVIAGRRVLPPGEAPAGVSISVVDALAGTLGLCALIGVLVEGPHDWSNPAVIALGVAALLLLTFFALWQRFAADPLLPRVVPLTANGLNILVGAVLFGTFFVITLYLQQVRQLSPLVAGLVYVPVNLALLAGARLATRLINRSGAATALGCGFAIQAAGLIWWSARLPSGGSLVGDFLLPASLWAAGLGVSVVAAFVCGTTGVPPATAGVAAGMITTTLNVGGAIGVALLSAVAQVRLTTLAGTDSGAAQASSYRFAIAVAAAICLCGAGLTLLATRRTSRPRPPGSSRERSKYESSWEDSHRDRRVTGHRPGNR